jgi:HK97 family phage portal protein
MIVRGRHGNVAIQSRDANLGAFLKAEGLSRSGSETVVNAKEVAGLPAWKQAIRIASEAIAKHRLRVWRGEDADRRRVTGSWQARFFAGQPNERYSWFYAWECTEASLTARSNAYWLKTSDGNRVSDIYVVHPDLVDVRWNKDLHRAEYRITLETGKWTDWLTSAEVLHFRVGFSSPGSLLAPSPIEEHRRTWATSLAKTKAEEKQYTKGLAKTVAVVFPEKVTEEQAKHWRDVYIGSESTLEEGSQVKVFGGDPRIETIGLSLQDAQFVESQAFSIYDVGRILGVPPSLLWAATAGDDKPITPEHEEDRWTRYGLEGRRMRIEGTIQSDPSFFGPGARDYPMFDWKRVRSDAITESRMLVTEVQSGILLPDEARAELGLPPLPDGAGQIPQVVPVGGMQNPNMPADAGAMDTAAQ